MMPPVPAPAAAAPPVSMVAAHARPRPIPAGSRPCADDRARVLRHPYTAMKKPAWTLRMPRAGASRPAAMRLTSPDLDTRQPRGVTNPQPGEAVGTPQAGPTLRRSLNSSMQAAINAVPGRAVPRKKPTPSSISRSPASIARPRPANSSTPPSRPGRLLGLRRDPPRIPGALFDRLGLRRIRAARLGQQPDGLRPELRRVSRALRHGPIISHRARGNAEQKTVHIIINEKGQYRIYSK